MCYTEPLVSDVVPTSNRPGERLDRCIQSLLSQTYKNIEILICDDKSTNHTKEWIGKNYDFSNLIF